MSVRVYSPTGEPFDIPRRDLADKLILEEGWTQTPAEAVAVLPPEKSTNKSKRRPRKKSVERTTEDTPNQELLHEKAYNITYEE